MNMPSFLQKPLAMLLLGIGVSSLTIQPISAQEDSSVRFFCGTSEGYPATILATPTLGEAPIITWKTNLFGDKHPPQERCQIVSQRFQTYHNEKTLDFITTGTVNGYPVVCVARTAGGPCEKDRVLFTLLPGKDPNQALQQIFSQSGPYENGDPRTMVNGRLYLNVKRLINSKLQNR